MISSAQNLTLTPEEAAFRLIRRKRMQESLIGFAQNIDIPGAPIKDDQALEEFDRLMATGGSIETGLAAHHILLMHKLQKTMEMPYGRLMVFMPPGAAKSTYCTGLGPVWYMGNHPGAQIILCSYGTDLAKKHGTKARAIVSQPNYIDAFNTTLSKKTGAREMWALDYPGNDPRHKDRQGSEYMSGGLLSGLTGNRAIGVVIDDPIRGRKDADSKIIRDDVIAAFEDDLRTRFIPKAWMVLVQTRWHDEDLGGYLLPEDYDGKSGLIECRDGLTWDVVNIVAKIENDKQAEYDPLGRAVGEYLWPEWFDKKHWFLYEPRPGEDNSPNPRTWAALYQQQPRPDTGNQWERDWVEWYDLGDQPKDLNLYCASDYAVSEDENDWTEHGIGGLDQQGDLWIVDWWYGQQAPDITIDALLKLCKHHKVNRGFDEAGVIEKAIKPQFAMRMRQMQIFLAIEYLPCIGNKVARFFSIRGMGSSGKVHIPRCPWGERLINQMCVFPGRFQDDACDVMSLFGRGLEGMPWSRKKLPKEPKKGLKFGSWEWLCAGTESKEKTPSRVF